MRAIQDTIRTGVFRAGSIAAFAATLLVLGAFLATSPAAATDKVADTEVISLGGEPNDLAVDEARNVVYVSILDKDEIVTVDLGTLQIVARHTFSRPAGLALSSSGEYLYVALNATGSIARVDLSDWSSDEVSLPLLGDHRTWAVVEVSPDVVLVSANPNSMGLAWIVQYDFAGDFEERVASDRVIRGGPSFVTDGVGAAFIGEGFSPNSLYRLDLEAPGVPIAAEDVHGSVSGTQVLAISPDGSFLVLGSGQKIDPDTLVEMGLLAVGVPVFSDDGNLVYSYMQTDVSSDTAAVVSVSNAATTELVETFQVDCGASEFIYRVPVMTKAAGSADLLATTADSLCVIHTDTVRELPPPPPPPIPEGGSFFDDDGSVHEGSIEAIAELSITKGCNPPYQTGFCPGAAVTREQMAAFLGRALGLTDVGGGNEFVDDDGSIFENDIAKLAAAGVTRGCNPPVNDHFCPKQTVTRGQMAAFLVRAFGYSDDGGGDLFIDDDNSVFERDIDRLAVAGITKGCNPPANDRFCPDAVLTRAEMATFLARALQLPVRPVPERPATLEGTDLRVVGRAIDYACSGENGEVCRVSDSLTRHFFLATGWSIPGWSDLSSADQSALRSDRLRVEAHFDNVPIQLVEWPFEVVDDVGLKSYSFQFPEWLEGEHILEVVFIDETTSYVWTLEDSLSVYGAPFASPATPELVESGSPDDPGSSRSGVDTRHISLKSTPER